MKDFIVGFEDDGIYSVNMIWANTGIHEREAVEDTARRKAEKHGYKVAFIRELARCEVQENRLKGMPYYPIDEESERKFDPSFAD